MKNGKAFGEKIWPVYKVHKIQFGKKDWSQNIERAILIIFNSFKLFMTNCINVKMCTNVFSDTHA